VANPQYAREVEVDFADDLSSFDIGLPGVGPTPADAS
jgi:hypothetical protein